MQKLNVILDTDIYNEIDDQYAFAYLLANDDKLNIEAITIAHIKLVIRTFQSNKGKN